ncbi:MAG: hypothetical protein BGN91_11765 [Nitrobacter sp. 62-13]|uniref:hypothetical protein n=1 Tax=Nitrobacter sp. 62-13 TaxID=1895797 RepID=UPI00095C6C39|nr:hypothetical protein [Nitrobacter sp. 62-13]OJU25074.1 MAG: hypothetical protein BGN91_11765 [Nitrobacter sp. 62-13]
MGLLSDLVGHEDAEFIQKKYTPRIDEGEIGYCVRVAAQGQRRTGHARIGFSQNLCDSSRQTFKDA